MKVDITKLIEDEKYCKKIVKFYLKTRSLKQGVPLFFERHINKALNNLEFANFILDEHKYSIREKLPNKTFYDWCIVIYYYAIYHSTLTLLSKLGYESKNHLATISTITLFYHHKVNILQKKDIKFIIDKISLDEKDIEFVVSSKDLREMASYRVDESFDLMLAEKLQKETVEFVNRIRDILE